MADPWKMIDYGARAKQPTHKSKRRRKVSYYKPSQIPAAGCAAGQRRVCRPKRYGMKMPRAAWKAHRARVPVRRYQ